MDDYIGSFTGEHRLAAELGKAYLDLVVDRLHAERAPGAVTITLHGMRVINAVFRLAMSGRQFGVTDVAGDLGLPTSTVSKHVIGLASAGLVRHEVDPEDGRRSHVVLTPRGHAGALEWCSGYLEECRQVCARAGWVLSPVPKPILNESHGEPL